MKPNETNTQGKAFKKLLQQARSGQPKALNQFFKQLYQKGKHSLIKLTQSEAQAEEYFQVAVAKFWAQCVDGEKELPNSNVEGYIYRIARFHCIDEMRKKSRSKLVSEDNSLLENNPKLAEEMILSIDQVEDNNLKKWRQAAIRNSIQKLSDNCQKLFKLILEEGIEKSKDMMQALGVKEVRRVSVLRHECSKRLKVLAANELERLIKINMN